MENILKSALLAAVDAFCDVLHMNRVTTILPTAAPPPVVPVAEQPQMPSSSVPGWVDLRGPISLVNSAPEGAAAGLPAGEVPSPHCACGLPFAECDAGTVEACANRCALRADAQRRWDIARGVLPPEPPPPAVAGDEKQPEPEAPITNENP